MKKPTDTPKKRGARLRGLREQARQHKATFIVYVVLRLIVLAILALALVRRDYESAFICGLVLVLFLLPGFVSKNFGIQLPTVLEIVILLFIFAAEILGELQNYYVQFAYWDTVLHTINGFVCAAFGFSLVDILCRNKQEKFRLSPMYMALVAFCFSMTVGVLWEFFEYGMDTFFHLDMQKDTVIHSLRSVNLDPTGQGRVTTVENISSVVVNGQELGLGGYLDIGLHDTMGDLFVNFIGAVVFSVIGFFYIKHRGKGPASQLAEQFIPRIQDPAPAGQPENQPGELPPAE